MRWTENCPNCQGQRTVVIGTNSISTWRSVHSGIPQVLMLESVLFDSVINELNNGTECIFGKCVDGTNLVTVHGCVAIQRKIDKLQKCTIQQQKRLSVASGEEKPDAPVQAWGDRLESSLAEKELGVLVQKKLNMSQQSFLAVQVWGLVQKGIGCAGVSWKRAKKMITGLEHVSYMRNV